MRQYRHRFGLVMFACLFLKPALRLRIAAQEECCRLAKGPAQIGITDPGTTSTVFFTRGFTLALHQSAIGCKVLYPGKAFNVVYFIENDQRQDIADPVHRLQSNHCLRIYRFGGLLEVPLEFGHMTVVAVGIRLRDYRFDSMPV